MRAPFRYGFLLALFYAQAAAGLDASLDAFGAKGDGHTLCTRKIQQAIDEVATGGGGRVVVPAGTFKTGSLHLKQGVELHLSEGAVLLGSTDLADYPVQMTRIEGHFEPWRPALLNAKDLTGVRITGAGTFDGNGNPFWTAFWKRRAENPKCTNLEVHRPRLMYLENCRDVQITGVRLKDSGFWNLHLYKCRDAVVDGVSITAPHGDPPRIVGQSQPWDEISIDRAPSSDGIDVDSCQNITIRNCTISVGDDCIALKGTKGPRAMEDESSPPVENISVADCDFQSGHGVITCGSEATVVRNVSVTNCRVGAGIPVVRLKLRPDTPQLYENIVVDGIVSENAQGLFDVKPWTQFFDLQGYAPPKSTVRNVTVKNVSGSFQSLGELRGNNGDDITHVVLQDVDVQADSPQLRIDDKNAIRYSRVSVNGSRYGDETPSVSSPARASSQDAKLSRNKSVQEPPREWIDPATGHRVVRLSHEPGSQSLYFHQYPFSADGRKMVFTTRDGISTVDLQTREVQQVVSGRVRILVTGRKTGDVFYVEDGCVKAANLVTHKARLIARLPEQYRFSPSQADRDRWRIDQRRNPDRPRLTEAELRNLGWGNFAPNADETLIVGIGFDPDGTPEPRQAPAGESVEGRLGPSWASGRPVLMYVIDVATGEVRVIHRSHAWLNHLQCSPTDPGQILFCHEGPWHLVERTWLIRTDGTGLTQVHPRTMNREIGGHEFFSQDGAMVWYDLQTPRSEVFWLAGYDVKSGSRRWYHLQRSEWSVHYNVSPDGKLFSGDGGGPDSVANMTPNHDRFDTPQNGQWIYLFRPEDSVRRGLTTGLIETGVFHAERLVNLTQHDYDLEPNGIFTPDGKWLVFRSNMHGPSHVYMVELAKTK